MFTEIRPAAAGRRRAWRSRSTASCRRGRVRRRRSRWSPPPTAPEFRSIAGAGLVEAREREHPGRHAGPGRGRRGVRQGRGQTGRGRRPAVPDRRPRAAGRAEGPRGRPSRPPRPSSPGSKAAPRPEDVPPARAAVEEAEAHGSTTPRSPLERDRAAAAAATPAPASDYDNARFTYEAAQRRAGPRPTPSWSSSRPAPGRRTSKVAEAKHRRWPAARSRRPETEIDRRIVRALVAGEVLQLNVRPGQFAALLWNEPLMVLGDVEPAARPGRHRRAGPPLLRGRRPRPIATLKGRPGVRFPLEFVRVEPYVVPKRSLTGDNAERVDTRVLQVIYALPDERPDRRSTSASEMPTPTGRRNFGAIAFSGVGQCRSATGPGRSRSDPHRAHCTPRCAPAVRRRCASAGGPVRQRALMRFDGNPW